MRRIITPDSPAVREAVGVFTDLPKLYECVDELQIRGFDRSEISLLDHPHIRKTNGKDWVRNTRSTEDDPKAKRGPFIDPESLGDAQGAMIGLPLYIFTLLGAGIATALGMSTLGLLAIAGGSGLIGGLLGLKAAYWLKSRPERYYKRQLDHGGIPIWVRVKDKEHEIRALSALTQCEAENVHLHDLPDVDYEVRDGRTTVVHLIH